MGDDTGQQTADQGVTADSVGQAVTKTDASGGRAEARAAPITPRIRPGQLIGRYLGYYVSILPMMLGIIGVGFDARKQGWHDKLAGTVVIRGQQPASESDDISGDSP